MNQFVAASANPLTQTENGAVAFSNTSNALVDFFYQAPAGRTKGAEYITKLFKSAYFTDRYIASRIALWIRDIRGGAGERESFRTILKWLDQNDTERVTAFIAKVPEIGRWDDLLVLKNTRHIAFLKIADALLAGNALCAKWMPREKSADKAVALELMKFMGLSPKEYRKLLSNATKVVETEMCANKWEDINFSHVPSQATSAYRNAFKKHQAERYAEWSTKAATGEVKVNAAAIFPHDVLTPLWDDVNDTVPQDVLNSMTGQWRNLPDYMSDANVLPVVDTSGSMMTKGATNSSCLHAAISLGLYCAERNKGEFKNVIATFSESPALMKLNDNLSLAEKYTKVKGHKWGMTTDLVKIMDLILNTAKAHKVPNEDMPTTLLILSDMQFNACGDQSGLDMIRQKFTDAGYTAPSVVFWNLNSKSNSPAKFNEKKVALISGFSPSVLTSALSATATDPYQVMIEAISSARYNF